MKTIVFIVNDYLPKPSANGICVENICNFLNKEFNIHIICQKNELYQQEYEKINSIHVHRILTNERKKRLGAKSSIELNLVKINKYIKDCVGESTVDFDLERMIYRKIEELHQSYDIDVLIPVCFPFESIMACIRFKEHFNVPFIELLFDKFSDSNTRHRNRLNKRIKYKKNQSLEKKSFKEARSIIATNDWKNYFADKNLEVNFIGIPALLFDKEVVNFVSDNGDKKAIYAGSLSRTMRPVNRTSKILKQYFMMYNDLSIEFYTSSSNLTPLKKLKKFFPNKISIYNSISQSELKKRYSDVDLLISIGNIDITQTPSKVFEYIGMRKPIIHFYRDKKDPVNLILSDYENSLLVNQYGNYGETVEQIREFISKEMCAPELSILEKKYNYALPEYVAEKLALEIRRID